MPRNKGSVNSSSYKYLVKKDGGFDVYISQKEIQDKYNIKRTTLYYIINHPEKTKNNHGLVITKLEPPLSVFQITQNLSEFGKNINYNKIVYNINDRGDSSIDNNDTPP